MNKNLIECATCGYPLTEDERERLVEKGGKMCKPWVGLTYEDIREIRKDYPDVHGLTVMVVAMTADKKLKEKNHEPRKQYKDLCGND